MKKTVQTAQYDRAAADKTPKNGNCNSYITSLCSSLLLPLHCLKKAQEKERKLEKKKCCPNQSSATAAAAKKR